MAKNAFRRSICIAHLLSNASTLPKGFDAMVAVEELDICTWLHGHNTAWS